MASFGWNYPPGVTGMEPEIAGGFDCDCIDSDHDACDDKECECEGHDNGCPDCGVRRGCRCDDMYEAWKDRQQEYDY